jgi:hypothetical protein
MDRLQYQEARLEFRKAWQRGPRQASAVNALPQRAAEAMSSHVYN